MEGDATNIGTLSLTSNIAVGNSQTRFDYTWHIDAMQSLRKLISTEGTIDPLTPKANNILIAILLLLSKALKKDYSVYVLNGLCTKEQSIIDQIMRFWDVNVMLPKTAYNVNIVINILQNPLRDDSLCNFGKDVSQWYGLQLSILGGTYRYS